MNHNNNHQEIIDFIISECLPENIESLFDEMLDDSGAVEIAELTFYPSKILSECDPIAYRCGLSEYQDQLSRDEGYIEIYEELYTLDSVNTAIDQWNFESDIQYKLLDKSDAIYDLEIEYID